MDIDYQALGKRISNLRRQKKLTQEELAEKTDLSTNYISHIENSRSIPSLETLMKLCAAMDVTPNELLLGTSQNRTDYLQTEVQQKLTLCTPSAGWSTASSTCCWRKRNSSNKKGTENFFRAFLLSCFSLPK